MFDVFKGKEAGGTVSFPRRSCVMAYEEDSKVADVSVGRGIQSLW